MYVLERVALWTLMGVLLLGVTWNSSFEADPTDSTLLALVDDKLREIKVATRERSDVEHEFSSIPGTSTGRHLQGAARAFFDAGNDCPSNVTALARTDVSGTPTNALDAGRVCFQSNGRVYVYTGSTWKEMGVPTGTIVLHLGTCGPGYNDVTSSKFNGITIRGTDVAASFPNIPDTPDNLCNSGNDCGAGTAAYDDTLDIAELPSGNITASDGSHTHDRISQVINTVTYSVTNTDTASGAENSLEANHSTKAPGEPAALNDWYFAASTGSDHQHAGAGSDTPHYHPFRTVRFCEKI